VYIKPLEGSCFVEQRDSINCSNIFLLTKVSCAVHVISALMPTTLVLSCDIALSHKKQPQRRELQSLEPTEVSPEDHQNTPVSGRDSL
jgi:hypothetical protein